MSENEVFLSQGDDIKTKNKTTTTKSFIWFQVCKHLFETCIIYKYLIIQFSCFIQNIYFFLVRFINTFFGAFFWWCRKWDEFMCLVTALIWNFSSKHFINFIKFMLIDGYIRQLFIPAVYKFSCHKTHDFTPLDPKHCYQIVFPLFFIIFLWKLSNTRDRRRRIYFFLIFVATYI